MTLFNMMKRSKSRSATPRNKSGYSNPRNENADFRPKFSNVKQNLDKYLGLAREAITTGDRITAESHYQFAEHYLRIMNEIKAQQPVAQASDLHPQGEETSLQAYQVTNEEILPIQEMDTSTLENTTTKQVVS